MQSRKGESDFIFTLAESAAKNIEGGYYHKLGRQPANMPPRRSLKRAILRSRVTPLIAEVKFNSPAEGRLRQAGDVASIARAYERGGVAGISVLTEPRHFDGDVRYVPMVKRSVGVPVLMKDIVIDPVQIDAAARLGADAVLFIAAIFVNRLARASLGEMFARARARGLEVLFEAHREEEYVLALDSEADLVGINNRNLNTLEVSLETTRRLLAYGRDERERLRRAGKDKPVISESGIKSRDEVKGLAEMGADGFLVGSAFMKSADPERAVRLLTGARA